MSSFLATKKPLTVEAIQWTGGNAKEVESFCDGSASFDPSVGMGISTLEGGLYAAPMDYIIKGVQGEFYPCKPDIFKATYDIQE